MFNSDFDIEATNTAFESTGLRLTNEELVVLGKQFILATIGKIQVEQMEISASKGGPALSFNKVIKSLEPDRVLSNMLSKIITKEAVGVTNG